MLNKNKDKIRKLRARNFYNETNLIECNELEDLNQEYNEDKYWETDWRKGW